jgi:hypothetical protein
VPTVTVCEPDAAEIEKSGDGDPDSVMASTTTLPLFGSVMLLTFLELLSANE